jgi:crotonobetainyl-CoA:carnitine CoA-transferase CaiB-like acyl-CoA transferase
MAGVLEGLRVLDLTWGVAGPMATMLLTDQGADVTRIERPAGENFQQPSGYKTWHRGKSSVELNLKSAEDLKIFKALASEADILVESYTPGVTENLGINYEVISELNPQLIYCSITAYGRGTRHSNRPGYDALVAARTGLQWECRGWYGSSMDRIKGVDKQSVEMDTPKSIIIGADRDGPIFTATASPSITAAYLAVLGVSAALRARQHTSRGQHIETSMMQGVIMSACSGWQRPENLDAKGYQYPVLDRRQTWGIVKAKDGWMCTWASMPEWFAAAGEGDILRIPNAEELSFRLGGLPAIEGRLKSLEATVPTFLKFTVDEWVKIAAESGAVSCQPVRTPEQALCDPALLSEGTVVEIEDPELGCVRQAGILYRLHNCVAEVSGPAPVRGEHTEAVKAALRDRKTSEMSADDEVGTSTDTVLKGPMEGIRIIDFGLAIAGPWSSQLLADMGAEVIKVDPQKQDYWLPTHMGIGVNRSKRFVGLNVKTGAGKKVAYQLIEGADIVVMNMRPQAAKKLGLDYESLKAINKRVIYCHTRGFEDSPRSLLPGNDQTGNALGGTEWEDGGCWNGGRPWFGTSSNGDIGNGYLAAIAMVQALYDRERTGKGQRVDASILNAALFNNSRVSTNIQGEHFERAVLDEYQTGYSALYHLYRCANNSWLCIAVVQEDHWQALIGILPQLADDNRFHDSTARSENDRELVALLDEVFSSRTAYQWFEILDKADVPCEVSSDSFGRELFDDKELLNKGWVTELEGNPLLGKIGMFGIGIDFSDTPCEVVGAPPVLWQHTREVLGELGYSEKEIDQLCASGAAIQPENEIA